MTFDPPAGLIAAARAAARRAYAPYSRFGVGAALLLADGTVMTGANLENASYGLSLCAETVAVASANAAGRLRDIVGLAVAGGILEAGDIVGAEPVAPCGRCRQVLVEAAALAECDLPIWCASADGARVVHHRLSELLPHAFGPTALTR